MPLPLIPIAIGLGAAGLGSAIYGATRKVDKAQPVPVEKSYYGGSAGREMYLRNQLGGREYDALYGANRYAKDAEGARGLQLSAYDRYRQQYEGGGPSLAARMAEQSAARMAEVQGQAAASARGGGGNQLLAQRLAMQQGAQVGQQGAALAAQMRMQEQLEGARGMADMSTRVREGDFTARGMSEKRASDSLGALMGMEGAILQADTQRNLATSGSAQAAMMANIDAQRREKDRWFQMAGGLLGAGGQIATAGASKG